jgi:hypothetical protein
MKRRVWFLLLAVIVIVAVIVLAASLHDVRFEPGRSFASSTSVQPPLIFPQLQAVSDAPLWKILLFWLAFAINLVLFFVLLPPELRRRIIRQILGFAIGVLALLVALHYRILQLPAITGHPAVRAGQSPAGYSLDASLPAFRAPQMLPWTTFLVSLFAFWGLLLLIWFFCRRWRNYRAGQNSGAAAIAGIARASLNDVRAGRQWGDVVIEAYARMSDAVSERRGLQRKASATPREFEEHLKGTGLPGDAVAGLTRLFESVRYGGRKSSQADVREATACLESILRACRGTA